MYCVSSINLPGMGGAGGKALTALVQAALGMREDAVAPVISVF